MQLFSDDTSLNYQPDHVLHDGDETIAVLDSKYYSSNKSPLQHNWARSRLFSYAYFWETEELAFFVPSGGSKTHPLNGKEGSLRIVAPESFNIEDYSEAIGSYFRDIFSQHIDPHPIDLDLQNNIVPIRGIELNEAADIVETADLTIPAVKKKSSQITRYIANDLSSVIKHSRYTHWKEMARKFSRLFDKYEEYDYALPVFRPGKPPEDDHLIVYLLKENDDSVEYATWGPCKMDWHREEDGPFVPAEDEESETSDEEQN